MCVCVWGGGQSFVMRRSGCGGQLMNFPGHIFYVFVRYNKPKPVYNICRRQYAQNATTTILPPPTGRNRFYRCGGWGVGKETQWLVLKQTKIRYIYTPASVSHCVRLVRKYNIHIYIFFLWILFSVIQPTKPTSNGSPPPGFVECWRFVASRGPNCVPG